MRLKFLEHLLFLLFTTITIQDNIACSGYKITVGNKTILGSNEDAWRTSPHIWFEKGKGAGQYGAAFTGSRYDGENGYAPQSGMNEMGLAFERLASYHPKQVPLAGRKTITNPTQYLKNILHICKSVEEVKNYISSFDHSYFIEDVFLYVDQSGQYLVVEPYTLTLGNQPSYVISNFCPSITSEQQASKLDRYQNGVAFLQQKMDTSLQFCTALSDTMHVRRKKIGDGTLLSSIWDLSNGTVNLYFYHDYTTTVHLNLSDELKKGDHSMAIETLFPHNSEFEKLKTYKTPKNSFIIGVFIVYSGGFFLLTSFFFLIQHIRNKGRKKYANIQLLLFPLGLILSYYMYVLSGSINVFYFPSPYVDPTNVFVSLTSYMPFLILLLILPFSVLNYRLIQYNHWGLGARVIFTLNNFTYIILAGLFAYWRFYDVFSESLSG